MKKLFNSNDLFEQALTHRSWVNEHKGARTSNERLEFLGDAVLEFVVSQKLFRQFPNKEEGFLTALRANIVNTVALSEVAEKLDLGSLIYLSKGEEESGGRVNQSLLADTVEAIIGGLFMDQGLEASEEFINKNILNDLDKKANSPLKDSKSALQEYVQSKNLPTPRYKVIEETGPDHDKKFVIEVMVGDKVWGKGAGRNKSAAEQESAKNAFELSAGNLKKPT